MYTILSSMMITIGRHHVKTELPPARLHLLTGEIFETFGFLPCDASTSGVRHAKLPARLPVHQPLAHLSTSS